MATPDEVTVWIGLDVGKEEHFADVLDDKGDPLFAKSISNDEVLRTRLLFRRCFGGRVEAVGDYPHYGWQFGRRAIVHEWFGLVHSTLLAQGC